jgi:hypothetical protein
MLLALLKIENNSIIVLKKCVSAGFFFSMLKFSHFISIKKRNTIAFSITVKVKTTTTKE